MCRPGGVRTLGLIICSLQPSNPPGDMPDLSAAGTPFHYLQSLESIPDCKSSDSALGSSSLLSRTATRVCASPLEGEVLVNARPTKELG